MKEDKTIHYYNSNAREFVLGTVSVDLDRKSTRLNSSHA